MNILVTLIYFTLTITWSLAHGCGQNELTATKNADKSLAMLMAMAMQRYNAGRIAQWNLSRNSLEATGCRHWASACAVSPRWPPWLTNLNKTHKTLTKHNFYLAAIVLLY